MTSDESVWITGVGAGTPSSVSSSTRLKQTCSAGRSGVSLVTRFPTDDYPSRIAAQIDHIPQPPGCDPLAFSARPSPRAARSLVCRTRASRRGSLGPASRRAESVWCSGLAAGVDAPLGRRSFRGRCAALFSTPRKTGVSTIERVRRGLGLLRPGPGNFGRVRLAATTLSSMGFARLGFAWGSSITASPPPATWPFRRSGSQPSATVRALPAERKPVRGFPSVRPRTATASSWVKRVGRFRSGAIIARARSAPGLRRGCRLRIEQRRPPSA